MLLARKGLIETCLIMVISMKIIFHLLSQLMFIEHLLCSRQFSVLGTKQ